jgi:DNA repair photolyase/DNA-binding NarL/FixJ family response regulator
MFAILSRVRVEYREEPCRSALNRVRGMPFAWSLNPYMGCAHRCTFCYVRAFEARADRPWDDRYGASIRVKTNVADVLRRELARPSWQREPVAVGAATDPYQPAEGRYRLTRACIEAFAEAASPFSIITRGPLIVRDADVLAEAARRADVSVTFSVPTLDHEIWRRTEPGTSPPRQRLRALSRLVEAGIDARVGMAPILPGLTDRPELLAEVVREARAAGATGIWANLLYLRPGTREHFLAALERDWARAASRVRAPVRPRRLSPPPRYRPCAGGSASARPQPRGSRPPPGAARTRCPSRTAANCDYVISGPRSMITRPLATSEITCLIVDDHEVVREGLRLSLSRAPHIRVIGEAADGEAAVALAERRRPNVVIMDVRMPGMDGLEATKELMDKVPDSSVLIFTAYSERSLLSRGLESGAKGYVLKEAPHETLLRAIEKVASGEGYVDPALMPAFLTGRGKDDMLTGREREILQLLADGMSNADVATQLFISQETVKSHVRHILAKLEADTRTHAVAIALREAIID